MKSLSTDFLIVGGGIVGLSIARALGSSFKTSKITIIEKETSVGQHQSTLNSGVIHAGIYYDEGTNKAKLCVRGSKLLTQYCIDNKLPLLQCGKLIVAKNENELEKLHHIYGKGIKNGAVLELINETQARKIEPHLAKTLKYPMIWSPNTSSGDGVAVMKQLESDVKSLNVDILCNQGFRKLVSFSDDNVTIETSQGTRISTSKFINCAGLYSEKIAKQFGEAQNYALLPLKGIFLLDKLPYQELNLRSLVYPVPPVSKAFSFLGLHTTIYPDGKAKLGPTAIPGFWREHYHGLERINFGEMGEIMTTYLMALFSAQGKGYLSSMIQQFKNYDMRKLVQEGSKLVDIYENMDKNYKERLTRKRPGIQAQLLDTRNYELVNDFEFVNRKSHLHIMNIASPGWTSGLAIGEHINNILQLENKK